MAKITERIDAITGMTPEYAQVMPPAPKSVKVELTARCDFKCFFCASHQRLREKSDMTLDEFERIAVELRAAGVEELGLFYLGESFVLKNLVDYVKVAKSAGFPYLFLTTNGLKATHMRVREVMEAGLDSLKFSINWCDEKQFQEVTGLPGKQYKKVLENLKDAYIARQQTGSNCGLYASSILYDGEQRERMKDLVQKHVEPWVDEHYYLPLYNQGALTTDVSKERGFIPIAGNQGRVGALRDPLPCWSAFTEGHVTFDGKLSACCFDHSSDWEMGDLKKESFMSAWHSDRFVSLRAAHLKKDIKGTACEHCVAYQ